VAKRWPEQTHSIEFCWNRIGMEILLICLLIMCSLVSSISRSPLLLGSGSASRKLILKTAGIDFDVFKVDIDERAIGDRSNASKAQDLVLLLANLKADAILASPSFPPTYRGRVLLTADQVVVCNDAILEKPNDETEARHFLAMYSAGHAFSTVGSIVLTDTTTTTTTSSSSSSSACKINRRVQGVSTTNIYFDPIPLAVQEQLLAQGEVYHCAGGLMVESPLVKPYIRKMEGEEDSAMGLSLSLLHRLMRELNATD